MLKVKTGLVWLVGVVLLTAGAYALFCRANLATQTEAARQRVDACIRLLDGELKLQSAAGLTRARDIALASVLPKILNDSDPALSEELAPLHKRLLPVLEALSTREAVDLLWVLDGRGRVIARLEDRDCFGDDLRGLPVVKTLMQGRAASGTLYLNSKPMQIAGAPVWNHSKAAVIGGVVLGFELDRSWLEMIRRPFFGELAIFEKDGLRVHTGAAAVEGPLEARLPALPLARDHQSGATTKFAFTSDGRSYIGRAILFDGALASFRAGVLTYAALPPKWLPYTDWNVQVLIAMASVLALLGFLTVSRVSARLEAPPRHERRLKPEAKDQPVTREDAAGAALAERGEAESAGASEREVSEAEDLREALPPELDKADALLSFAPDLDDADEVSEYFNQVYREYLNMREVLGQPTHTINSRKFLKTLGRNTRRICEKTGCRKVRFTVYEKDGKAAIKASPARRS